MRDDANVSMWAHAIHVLHEMARFFSLGTVSSTLLLLETTISCMCGLSQCNLKSFLDDTGTLLVLGRRFLGERHHMLRFRAPGQHIHIVWLLHCIAASRGLALISFQYNAGKRRRKHACKKICCFPPTIQAALRDKGTAREKARVLCTFLSMQFIIGYSAVNFNMCSIYCVIGRTAAYIGKSEHEWIGAIGAPLGRGLEHLYDVFFHNGNVRCENRKTRAFRHENLADFSQYYLFSVPTDCAHISEKLVIRISCASANTTYATSHAPNHKLRRRPAKKLRQAQRASGCTVDRRWYFAENPHEYTEVLPPTTALNMPFRLLYMKQVQMRRVAGPLSIFLCPLLFVAFLSRPKHTFDFVELTKRVARNLLFHAAQVVSMIRSQLFRSVAIARLNMLLEFFGESRVGTFLWRIPWPVGTCDVRQILNNHWRSIGLGCRLRFKHVSSMLSLVPDAAVTYKRWFNIVSVARNMDGKKWLGFAHADKLSAWSGKSFRQLKLFHKLRKPVVAGQLWQQMFCDLKKFSMFAKCPFGALQFALNDLFSVCAHLACSTLACFHYLDRRMHDSFVQPSLNEVLVAEDKDPSAAWLIPKRDYCLSIIFLLEKEASKWELTELSLEDAWQFKKTCFDSVACAGFGPRWRPDVMPGSLPYMYATVKAKCFVTGRRICQNEAHSCLRKIVSYSLMERSWRNLFRKVSRATMILILKLGLGDEVTSLATAALMLRRRFQGIVQPDVPLLLCSKCSSVKQAIEVAVADAGAMYEAIDSGLVLTCLNFYIERAKDAGYVGVAVLKTRKLHGFLAKHNFHKHNNVDLFTFEQLRAIHMLSLSQKFVSVGNLVYRQLRGVPIGGLLSKCQTSLVLCAEEYAWEYNKRRQVQFGLDETLLWRRQVAACRYVDDCCLLSPYLCSQCLFQCLCQKSCVQYERQNSSASSGTWLDMEIHFRGAELLLTMHKPEEQWIAGTSPHPKKFRLEPYHGMEVQNAKARILGTQARLMQIYLDGKGKVCSNNHDGLTGAIFYCMNIWQRSGYSTSYVRRTWARHLSNPLFARIADTWRA